jgi:chromate transport protein ChrA
VTVERDQTPEQDPLAPAVPPAGEEIHLPGPSIQPLLVAVGTTIALVGLTTSWLAVVAGSVIVIWTVVRWIADTRREMAELPLHHGDH